MTTRSSRLSIIAMLLLLVTACAGEPPVQELRMYDAAFADARAAGEGVLDHVSAALVVRNDRQTAAGGERATLYPESFDPEEVTLDPDEGLPDEIRVRQLAFRTVADYNDALLALAEGRTLAQVNSVVTDLSQTVQMLLPLAGVAGGPLAGLAISGLQSAIDAAEQARERAVIERAIMDGHDEVDGIIAALIADTPDLYLLLRSRWELELDAADKAMGDTWRIMQGLARRHSPATDPAAVKEIVRIEERVERAFASTTPPAQVGSLPTLTLAPAAQAGAPFDAALVSELQSQTEILEAAAERHARGVRAIKLAHEGMREYVLLLRRTRQSLNNLAALVAAPPDSAAVAARILETGVELRHHADRIQQILGALRAR